jgi:sugar transferase EpsL
MKIIFDKVVSLLAILITLPLLLTIGGLIGLVMGLPILFLQKRPGLHGKPFIILKFRTMTDGRDAAGNLLPDNTRLTTLGKFLRNASLDELPQFFNVLKGEMSLVGPRPLLMEYLDRYSPMQARRHLVKPGITGWAQVNGGNALQWEEAFALDIWYVDHYSFWLDLKIIIMTITQLLWRKNDSVTRSKFMRTPE